MSIRCAHCHVDRTAGNHPCWNCGATGVEPCPETADYIASLQREAFAASGIPAIAEALTPAPDPSPTPPAPSPPPPATHSDPER